MKYGKRSEREAESWSLPPRGAWIEISEEERTGFIESSLPPRGAWIEIRFWQKMAGCSARRSPRGERGLKCRRHHPRMDEKRRSPRGERGLKYVGFGKLGCELMSLPPRGAWIEILFDACSASTHGSRSPRGERGLKSIHQLKQNASHFVAPPAGSVD